MNNIQNDTRLFIDYMRGASVLRVVLVHLGLGWFFLPYSQYVGILFPILFFVSGAVSFNSFIKADSKSLYLAKRVSGITIPFLLFMMPVALLYSNSSFSIDIPSIINWLILTPNSSLFPFPIGQIWFIHCLLLMAIVTFPMFYLAVKMQRAFMGLIMCFVIISLTLPYQIFMNNIWINNELLSGYLVYETLMLIAYYLAGSIYVLNQKLFESRRSLYSGVVILAVGLTIDILNRYFSLYEFSEVRPNTYLSQSLGVLLIIVALKPKILRLLETLKPIRTLFLYCNTHAYSLFILHIPILALVEYTFGWHDLGQQPLLALLRLILVVVTSLVLSVPFTYTHKSVMRRLFVKPLPAK